MKKTICLLLALVMLVGVLAACGEQAEPEKEVVEAPAAEVEAQPAEQSAQQPAEAEPVEQTAAVEQTEACVDPELPMIDPELTALTIDGGYTVEFDPAVTEYTVSIPDGRPRVPKISATAVEGAKLKLMQAMIPDGEAVGTAAAVVTTGKGVKTYTVTVTRDPSLGFQLQYGDRYCFVPSYELKEGESFSFSSSSGAASVNGEGVVTCSSRTDSPVTVTASVGGKAVDKLVIDKIVKAPIDMFLIIGQSNAYGYHDVPGGFDSFEQFAETQKAICDAPAEGTVWCDDITTSYDEAWFSGMYDLSQRRSGFSPALGKQWYKLSGEKVMMLQTAIGSTPIEAWTKDPSLMFYGIDCYAQTVDLFNTYKAKFTAESSDFEMNRVMAFWLQGETCEEYVYDSGEFTWEHKNGVPNYKYHGDWRGAKNPDELMSAKQYNEYFLSMVDSLKQDVGLEFIGILPVRAMSSVSSPENREAQTLTDLVPVRAAQFALNFMGRDDISVVTLKTEIGRTEGYFDHAVPGWGYMGSSNVHYNQLGYNAIGKDAAKNAFAMFSADSDTAAISIEVVDKDGQTHLANGGVITAEMGRTHQITAYVMPLFAANTKLSFSVADESVATVDEYGAITVAADATLIGKTTTLSVSNGELTRTVTIQVGK